VKYVVHSSKKKLKFFYFSSHKLPKQQSISFWSQGILGVKKIEWPAQSPGLNSIENVWKLLKDGVQKRRRLKNQEHMWLAVESEWKAISQSKLETLVATMPQRIKDVIAASGGSTHW
jgi:hypothetical protein